jgi:hypothetical protein
VKNDAKLPASAVTTKMAHASRSTSTTFPAVVTGFFSDDETVRSCTPVKKTASPNPWMSPPFLPFSKRIHRDRPGGRDHHGESSGDHHTGEQTPVAFPDGEKPVQLLPDHRVAAP